MGQPIMVRKISWAFTYAGPFKLDGPDLTQVGLIWAGLLIFTGPTFSPEWTTVGPSHVSTYHRRLLSNEWMTSVPTMSRHVFPLANDDFTSGKSPLVAAVNGLSDPKPDPIA